MVLRTQSRVEMTKRAKFTEKGGMKDMSLEPTDLLGHGSSGQEAVEGLRLQAKCG